MASMWTERLKEKIEETFGCEFELFIEFTCLISWYREARIGWHSDDNRLYLKQRDFSVRLYSFLCVVLELSFYWRTSNVAPSAGNVIMYTADDGDIHSVDEITDGKRLTLEMWS
ncbi:hypothetical protein Bca52824_011285 [Brassica carinata]|uniref:Uncharacterized protein n=1 Tax=Brassica carinata TaxID=52824 RepID=A0A8X8BC30_BRACI|nr:hypothetical protein Bca52824_011285 [Brassica carinata]